ncbi:MAG: nitric oxide reductase activation protein NorD [Acidobacteriota bacterium]
MAEAEDVLVDAARHAVSFVQTRWHRRRAAPGLGPLTLLEVRPVLQMLLSGVFGRAWQVRVAQPPAPVTLLTRLFQRAQRPWPVQPLAYGDAVAIWLPRDIDEPDTAAARSFYQLMALQQAQRSVFRGLTDARPGVSDLARVIEADQADAALIDRLPGLRQPILRWRTWTVSRRPPLKDFAPERRASEAWLREALQAPIGSVATLARHCPAPETAPWLLRDGWTGTDPPDQPDADAPAPDAAPDEPAQAPPLRSAALKRRPTIRAKQDDEDDAQPPGAWMIQTAQPHEHAQDPFGLQRPMDRDGDSPAQDHAESLAELPEARLLRTSQMAQEVLISDAPPPSLAHAHAAPQRAATATRHTYPEWDFAAKRYREAAVSVWESEAVPGDPLWVAQTLKRLGPTLQAVRRQFEMLRTQPLWMRGQHDGEEIDLGACLEAKVDRLANRADSSRGLYQSTRLHHRDCAIVVLTDISGSTDGWVEGDRRIIDIEREALLLLSVALQACGDPHALLAFSGQGPHGVRVRVVQRFGEAQGPLTSSRIGGLDAEHFTRTGAALRHASQYLATQPSRQPVLLLLSDGKPNDQDHYEGRYGVEDMRQAVREAQQRGQSVFCLTIDRQAPTYMSRIFGPHRYAVLRRPQDLPSVLLKWMRAILQ